jgi:hypothetical protein
MASPRESAATLHPEVFQSKIYAADSDEYTAYTEIHAGYFL